MQFYLSHLSREPRQHAATSHVQFGEQTLPLLYVHNLRSKRYILRIRPNGTVRVTIPRRGSESKARQFVEEQKDWIERQIQRIAARPVRNPAWQFGTEILFRGELVTLVAGDEPNSVTFVDQRIRVGTGDGDIRPSIQKHLHRLAAVELPPKVFLHAQQHSLNVKRVSVRNQRSRWGSCSRRGTISLNWRLIQAPEFVSTYIILHELMHLRQMNHSAKFWREVQSVCPDFQEAERWLKTHSSLLR